MKNEANLQELSVVYVEDDEITRDNIGRFLRRRVRWLGLANNGLQGLELVMSKKPNIVITDIQMPKMDGIEMIYHIRKEYSKDELPILVVSAFNDIEHYADQANDYLNKPISIDSLCEAIEKLTKL